MVTSTLLVADPPTPLQARLNVLADVTAETVCVPFAAFVPDQSPEAVQEVAFVEVQDKETEFPLVIAIDPSEPFAFISTVGTDTFTVTLSLTVPPVFAQVMVYVAGVVVGISDWDPLVPLVPDQLPDATQDVAFAEVHDIEKYFPLETATVPSEPFAFISTVGTATFKTTLSFEEPPGPVQVMV